MRLLLTLDAVGGVWRYALDLAGALGAHGIETVFLGFGPAPSPERAAEAEAIGTLDWSDAPLDWLAGSEAELGPVPGAVAAAARRHRADLLQVSPAQAADLAVPVPVVAVSHSCVPTWFGAVRGEAPPPGWDWHAAVQARGLGRADRAVAPSASHAAMLRSAYGPLPRLGVVWNGSDAPEANEVAEPCTVALGRWWDEGKNAATLDRAAARTGWPVRMVGALEGPNGARFAPAHAEAAGELPQAQAQAVLRRAGLFVAPSLYEPFGLAVVEAARAGRPLVLADIPTFRELWGGAAAFFPPRDDRALAGLLDDLAADAAERARLGRAARERARRYGVGRQAAAMAGLYRELLPLRAAG